MGDQKIRLSFHLPPLKFDFPLPASTIELPQNLHLDWFKVEEQKPPQVFQPNLLPASSLWDDAPKQASLADKIHFTASTAGLRVMFFPQQPWVENPNACDPSLGCLAAIPLAAFTFGGR